MSETQKPDLPPPGAAGPARLSAGMRAVLIGSLALNLLVLGIVGGGMIAGRGAPHPFGDAAMSLGPFADALEGTDRAALRDRLRDRMEHRRETRGSRAAALAAFVAAVRTDPFDPAEIETIFADQREKAVEGLAEGQAALMERLSAMTPDARAAFADRLEREFARHGGAANR